MKQKKQNSLHDKAIRLLEGGLVEIDALRVRAIKVPIEWDPCYICSMGCLCTKEVCSEILELCKECDTISGNLHYLEII